jgi:hypothetical protein
MSQRPSSDPTRPRRPAPPDDATLADADSVPGDPPVPITVWRTPASDDGGLLGHPLAARLVAAYTRRGDTLLDATTSEAGGDPVLAGDEAALAVCRWPLPRAGLIDPVIALGGLRRRLRPGGVLAAVVPTPPPGIGPAQLGPAVRAATAAAPRHTGRPKAPIQAGPRQTPGNLVPSPSWCLRHHSDGPPGIQVKIREGRCPYRHGHGGGVHHQSPAT